MGDVNVTDTERQHIFNQFYKTYHKRIAKWARNMCSNYDVPQYVYQDLTQTAMLQAWKNIPGWDPTIANMWTYSYLGLRKAMLSVLREYHHNPKYGTKGIQHFIVSYDAIEDRELSKGPDRRCIDEIVYRHKIELVTPYMQTFVRTVMRKQFKINGPRIHRFMSYALDTQRVAQLARESASSISRQGYYNSVASARKTLQKEMAVIYAH